LDNDKIALGLLAALFLIAAVAGWWLVSPGGQAGAHYSCGMLVVSSRGKDFMTVYNCSWVYPDGSHRFPSTAISGQG
jgi:hypothetical protein